jgi:hypothetical protein
VLPGGDRLRNRARQGRAERAGRDPSGSISAPGCLPRSRRTPGGA